jgi:hypothetical protein
MPKDRLGAKTTGFRRDPAGFGWRGFCVFTEGSDCYLKLRTFHSKLGRNRSQTRIFEVQMFRTLARLLIANLIAVSLVAFAPAALVQPAAATGGFRSTLGQEFWVNFDANFDTSGTPTIYLSGAQNANVTITWPDQTTQQATVVAGTVTTVSATTKIATANQFTRTSDGISQTAIKIVSDAAISVYVLNQRTASTDASQAYPTEYQGFEYRILNSNLGEARFSVIASEAGTTTITVTPKATLGSRTGGVAYTQTLQQGDVYSLVSNSNMRGTLITSDKKISVTSSYERVDSSTSRRYEYSRI